MKWIRHFIAVAVLALMAAPASADPVTVRIAKQPGVGYLPLMVMEHEKLLEKHAKDAGIDVTTEWLEFTGGSSMNDALLSGRLDIATGGIPPLLTIWARTRIIFRSRALPRYRLTRNFSLRQIRK